MTDPIVRVSGGRLAGSAGKTGCAFYSIPYAAPPAGPRRFAAPSEAQGWAGVRDARRPGPTAPQRNGRVRGLDLEPLIGPGWVRGDDYLTLNIWTPEIGAGRAPVMLWVHGGGFVAGCKDAPIYDGSMFARDGIVCVTINYRLGIDGFLPVPGSPTNLGLRDVVASLTWVRDQIHLFGGDPNNITLFGESAGAGIVANLVTSPLAKKLFGRAIIQSGHGGFTRDRAVADRLVEKVARTLRIPPNLDSFRVTDPERCVDAVARVSRPTARIDLRDAHGREPLYGISRFSPLQDDDVLPQAPLDALKAGAGSDVDVLIGTNADEMDLFLAPLGLRERLPGWLVVYMLGRSQPHAREILLRYGYQSKGVRPGEALTRAMTDLVFRWPARRFAEDHRGRTHVYEFGWPSPAYGGRLGACHGLEMPFVFDTLSTVTGGKGLVGSSPPQDLASRIHRIWVDFATDGRLPWPAFDRHSRLVHELSTGVTKPEAIMPVAPYLP